MIFSPVFSRVASLRPATPRCVGKPLRGCNAPTNTFPRRAGFTLIELLLVITILSILMGFLFASFRAVKRYTREVSTRAELANIEAAFLQYYNHYGRWPVDDEYENDTPVKLGQDIIDTLAGKTGGMNLNPDQTPFFEILRIKDGVAVNTWGDTHGKPYLAKFNTIGDNTLENPFYRPGDPNNPEHLHRAVIVWTEHPEFKPGSEKHILGSWQQ